MTKMEVRYDPEQVSAPYNKGVLGTMNITDMRRKAEAGSWRKTQSNGNYPMSTRGTNGGPQQGGGAT